MKRFLKNTVLFCVSLLSILLNYLRHGRGLPYNRRGGKVAVLANGPSLKDALTQKDSDPAFSDSDFVVLNFFALGDIFKLLKPTHYCLADPMFFVKNHRYEDVKHLFEILQNEVDWPMNIYVPAAQYKRFLAFSGITNRQITIVKANTNSYRGFPAMRNWFYKKGLAMPRPQTVANLAIYVAINSGYDEINLFGADHTFFESMCINEKNQLCSRVGHYYDKDVQLKPILSPEGQIRKIADYVYYISLMFKSHDLLAHYAHAIGANILNCTAGSMIDSYPRRK